MALGVGVSADEGEVLADAPEDRELVGVGVSDCVALCVGVCVCDELCVCVCVCVGLGVGDGVCVALAVREALEAALGLLACDGLGAAERVSPSEALLPCTSEGEESALRGEE